MKIIPTIVLSLVAATAVVAAPNPLLQKRGWVIDQLKPLIVKVVQTLECKACVAALVGAKDVAVLNQSWVLDAVNAVCTDLKLMPADVCSGAVYSQGPAVLDALLKADLVVGGSDAQYICHFVGGICPAPAVTTATVPFPKPRPANTVAPASTGSVIDVLHLSDWHVDPLYVAGSEGDCGKPLCCRKYADSPLTASRPVSSWGDYKCDVPTKLGANMLQYAATVSTPAFSILTGDVPPHDIWLETKDSVPKLEADAYNVIGAGLVNKVFPTIGNHEAGPTNLYPTPQSAGDLSWLYAGLADDWSKWLPTSATASVRKYGAYTASPAPGLTIISLNTNFCYTLNFYLYGQTSDSDPWGQIAWLVQQLQAAEDAKQRVWIIGHIAPGLTDCLQNWSELYYQVVQRYSPHVIAEQFFGHTHYDEAELFFGPGSKSNQTAIATAWIGPSATTYTNLNPGFRLYKVDSTSWNIMDSQTYVADMDQSLAWDAAGSGPNWHLEYSARQAYGAVVPIADNQPLSASWWYSVTQAMEAPDSALFQKYWAYRNKSVKTLPACTSASGCQAEIICNIRAGKSSQSCSSPSFALKKRSDGESIFKRAVDKPWNQKLCGITHTL